MNECPLTLISGIYKCSDMGQGNCLFMLNESLQDGNLSHLKVFMEKHSNEYLKMWADTKRKGRIRESCLKYREIRRVAIDILRERKNSNKA